MFCHPIKSKTQKQHAVAQTISHTVRSLSCQLFRKTTSGGKLQLAPSPSAMAYPEKRAAVSKYPFIAVVIATLFFVSCQKEALTDPALNSTAAGDLSASASGSTAPKVNAGPDRVVVYPSSSSVTLSGSGSDSKSSVTFRWKQVSGVSKATIAKPNKPGTAITNLQPGLYTFILTVTNSQGVSSKDTVIVSVLEKVTWTIEGVTREALVHPASGNPTNAPVFIAFHGHGGTDSEYAAKQFEVSWPEAIVVYPQGLRTKSGVDKEGKLAGWQYSVGEVNSRTGIKDQDLKFFDAMLPKLKRKYNADLSLVFVHGWSNGGEFIYNVLWSARSSEIAGLSPAGATLSTIRGKIPVPVIHTAGTQDDKVTFNKQQRSVDDDRTVDKCSSKGSKWATGPEGLLGTKYASSINASVVMLQYDDGHRFPATVPPLIMQFFREVAEGK